MINIQFPVSSSFLPESISIKPFGHFLEFCLEKKIKIQTFIKSSCISLKSSKPSDRPRVLCRLFLAWTNKINRIKNFIMVRWKNLGQNHVDVGFWRPSGLLEVCYFGRNQEYYAWRLKPQAEKVYYGRKIFEFYWLRKMFADCIRTFFAPASFMSPKHHKDESGLTLRRPLRRKLRMRWFFDVPKGKESSFFKSDLTDPPQIFDAHLLVYSH